VYRAQYPEQQSDMYGKKLIGEAYRAFENKPDGIIKVAIY